MPETILILTAWCSSSFVSRIIDDLDLYILRFERFGREFPKSQNMSPDSFIQLALQLTYYKYETNLFQWVNLNSIRLNKPVSIDQSKLDSFEPVQIGSIEIRFMHVIIVPLDIFFLLEFTTSLFLHTRAHQSGGLD